MQLTFLGTSAGTPTRTRNVTAQLLRFEDGSGWLLDCGEGTQQRFLHGGLRAKPVGRILLTHLHGDHCYGVPGMLALIAIHGRQDPVEIIGPPGCRRLIETVLALSHANLPFAVTFVELEGGSEPIRRGAWTIRAWSMVHRVQSLGYVLREDPRPGRFHTERALAAGLTPGPDFGRLQRGEPVTRADGTILRPEEVCDPPRAGRKLVLLGDTADASSLHADGQGCDLLVHEATYDTSREGQASEWGHSTSRQAGRCAAAMVARRLILTHFSARYDEAPAGTPGIQALVAEAQAECPGTAVQAAEDLLTVSVPMGGAPT